MDERFTAVLLPFLKFHTEGALDAESDLRGLGLDSMQAIDLLFAIEDAYGISLPDEAMNDTTFATAGNLWKEVSAALTGQPGSAAPGTGAA
ncbi:acyl carrier protein [Streptomyces sp. NPDC004752]